MTGPASCTPGSTGAGGSAPLDGLERGGYRLVMTDQKSPLFESFERERKIRDFSFSIGVVLKDAKVVEVAWNSPAWKAGLTEGDSIEGIAGMKFQDADDLADAITQAQHSGAPIQLLVTSGRTYRTIQVEDRTGLRYPHLVRSGNDPFQPGCDPCAQGLSCNPCVTEPALPR